MPKPGELLKLIKCLWLFWEIFQIRKVEFPGVSWDPVDEGEELVYLNITGFKPEDMKLQRAKELSPKSFWGELNFLENRKLVLMKDELWFIQFDAIK